ncbi:MAG: DNA polymerase I [Legionellaceae bacterium]|nr:DNA polymerase I [Legionellaceae bacterium]
MENLPLILVDGSSYLFRAYHAMPPLTNEAGHPTGAMYGVINMLRRLISDYPNSHIAVVFDTKGGSFRNELYAEYKANRSEMPEELEQQIEPLFGIIKAMGFPLIAIAGVEADDVIGTLTTQATEQKMEVVVSTGDKDMAQLVNEHVTLVNTMTNTKMDVKGVKEKFGVNANQIIDYLTLIGDTSDNIPGVPKVGPKTAVKWLEKYGSLDEIIKHADEITGKVGENLRDFLPQLPLSKQLVTIKCDVELSQHISDLNLGEPDKEKLANYFKEFEFKTWLKEQLNDAPIEMKPKKNSSENLIIDKKSFGSLINKLKNKKLFAFDSETTSLNYMKAEIVGLSFATDEDDAVYIPVAHNYPDAPDQLDRTWVLEQLKPLLESHDLKKIGQNLKYDKEVLANYDITLNGIAFDTMLESYVYNSTASRHDMNSLALKYLTHKCISYEDVAGKGAKQICFSEVDVNTAGDYAAEDAEITLKLHQHFWPELQKDAALKKVFETIEMPLVNVLSKMERQGVLIDQSSLKKQSVELGTRISELEEKAYKTAGRMFNMGSPKQLREILFEELGIPVIKKTPTGQASTAEEVLSDLALDYPLPKLILEYRSLSKLKSTYVDALPQQINDKTGRVHTSFHQAVASTGRLSSSNPNLQNIPIRTEEGRRIRQAFIAPTGYKMVAADYSQVELRIMAHLSKDQGLLDAFSEGADIHSSTASQVFGVPIDKVDKEFRRRAKAINFGLIYGMSSFGLAKQLQVDRNTAQEYIDEYFRQYPGVKAYMENTRKKAHKDGFVETVFGRRLYLPNINTKNVMQQKAAERIAINAPMQGTAADIIKMAMINIDAELAKNNMDAKMILQVHDELIFEVAENDSDELVKLIKTLMQSAAKLTVPLIVDVGVGHNWDEAH